MERRTIALGSGEYDVDVDGPDSGGAVVLLPASTQSAGDYAALAERLHNSGLRTFIVGSVAGMSHDDVIALLDALGLHWVHLSGDGEGADLAWEVAARHFDRVSSLVVVGRGHPAVADARGEVLDPSCPAVEVSTTLVLGTEENRAHAYATGRHAYSDYRVVELSGLRSVPLDATAELATEIVLRSSPW